MNIVDIVYEVVAIEVRKLSFIFSYETNTIILFFLGIVTMYLGYDLVTKRERAMYKLYAISGMIFGIYCFYVVSIIHYLIINPPSQMSNNNSYRSKFRSYTDGGYYVNSIYSLLPGLFFAYCSSKNSKVGTSISGLVLGSLIGVVTGVFTYNPTLLITLSLILPALFSFTFFTFQSKIESMVIVLGGSILLALGFRCILHAFSLYVKRFTFDLYYLMFSNVTSVLLFISSLFFYNFDSLSQRENINQINVNYGSIS